MSESAVPIQLQLIRGCEHAESPVPFQTGVPLPAGGVVGDCSAAWSLYDASGKSMSTQCDVLTRWPDGSVRWMLVTGLLHPGAAGPLELRNTPGHELAAGAASARTAAGLQIESAGSRYVVPSRGAVLLHHERSNGTGAFDWTLVGTSPAGKIWPASTRSAVVLKSGRVVTEIQIEGDLGRASGIRFEALLNIYHGTSLFRLETTLHNPGRARHKGGYWDLGDPGSRYLKDFTLRCQLPDSTAEVCWSETPDGPEYRTTESLDLYQDSSGGDNWNSRNHLNREGRLQLQFRGYRVRFGTEQRPGRRASPIVSAAVSGTTVSSVLTDFWQKFPSSLSIPGDRLDIGLWPDQAADLHELQAGEQCTRTIWFHCCDGDRPAVQPLRWVHRPPVVVLSQEQSAAAGAIPESAGCPTAEYEHGARIRRFLQAAIDGPQSFFAKREVIDEYGWRNYGDLWADHEQAYHEGAHPIISHYNNQYDVLHSMLMQLLTSGDRRWWDLADPLARHLLDIDLYHTDRDKAAYNGGLFWHTDHYVDCGTATHRTYTSTNRENGSTGGGPGAAHNYSSGLLLYFLLTGNRRARAAVISLAEWVLAMDSGDQHLLALLNSNPTGFASENDAGRGTANSIVGLLNAWTLTNEPHYLDYAEQLIRRVSHPSEDLQQQTLSDAETRWSYTMFLHALADYLRRCEQARHSGSAYGHARAVLLQYARWMVQHERPYLDHPERLEFPTETWPAQELRKATSLLLAARYAEPAEQRLFLKRAQEILDWSWRGLQAFDSRYCTRPLALVLQQAPFLGGFRPAATCFPPMPATLQRQPTACSSFQAFVSQRDRIRSQISSPAALLCLAVRVLRPRYWRSALRQIWLVERLRTGGNGVRPLHGHRSRERESVL